MSYLVLARKYRPKVFAEVVGQEHVIRPLVNALKSGRTAHAYLFAGARGVGKTTAARLLAMALNCRVQDGERPCGVCESCVEISEGHAVDVFEIDGASNRGINEIRELRETIKYLPAKSDYKVYIIDEVHMLTKEAFNALLKTLEEPPEHVVFIFATTEAHKVLPTILSRCQRYDFKRIGLSHIVGRLEEIAQTESIQVGPGALRLIARESEGSLRDALSLFDQVIAYAGMTVSDEIVADALGLIDQTLIAGMAEALLSGDAGQALDLLDQIYNFGFETKDFALQVLDYFRSMVVVKVAREPEKILDMLDAELAEVVKIAAGVSLETLHFHFNAWLEVQDRLRRAGRPRLVLEALIIRLAQVEPLRPLAELTARLENLLRLTGPGSSSAPSGQTEPGRQMSPRTGSDRSIQTGLAGPGASGPRPPAVPADEFQGLRDWKTFMGLVRKESPFLVSFLEKSEIKEFGPAGVEIVFGQKNMAELVDQEKLVALLTKFLGSRPRLKIQVSSEAVSQAAEETASKKERSEAEKEILDHPLVKEAGQILSGEIIKVIPES